jgi:hypothetical protein
VLVIAVVFVWFDMMLKSVFFLYESYVKCGSARKRRRKCKFPWDEVPSTSGIHESTNKVRSTVLSVDKKPVEKRHVLAKEGLDEGLG